MSSTAGGRRRGRAPNWKFWIGILISVVLLYMTFRGASFAEIWKALERAKYIWLVPIVIINLGALFIRAYRWQFFFPPGTKLRYYSLLSATMIGFFANNVLPARMGEFVRAYLLSRREGIRGSMTFGTIVIERVFDFITMLMIFGGFALYNTLLPVADDFEFPKSIVTIGLASLLFSIGVLAVLVLLRFKQEWMISLIRRLLTPFSEKLSARVIRMFSSFSEGLCIFTSLWRIVITFILSFAIWFGFILSCEFIYKTFGLDVPLSASILLIIALTFGVSVPSAPGSFGTFHIAAKTALTLLKIETSTEAFAVLLHAVSYFPITIVGFIFLLIENVSFSEIKSSAGALTESAPETK